MRWRILAAAVASLVLAYSASHWLGSRTERPPQRRARPRRPAFSTLREPARRALAAAQRQCTQRVAALVAADARVLVDSVPTSLPALAGGEVLLSFFTHRSRVFRFVQRGREVYELPPLRRDLVAALVAVTRDEIEHGVLGGSHQALFDKLARAYAVLLAPAERFISRATRLSFAVNGLLRALPLHALLRQRDGRREFVGARWAVSYMPCLAWRGAPRAPDRAQVVAPAYGNAGQTATMLEGAMVEVRAIAPHFADNTFRQGTNVNAADVQRALSDPHAVVHYLGHGLSDVDDPKSQTALVLGGGAEVGVAELVRRGRLRAPLVVLASCDGAYAARFRDGTRRVVATNLAEALLAAGAGAAVASSWAVKDKQSARTMRIFYRHLRALGPAAAMQRAYAHQIARIKPPHPRFWGAYAIYGAARWR
ncbi:MAG: CHAT domain-containing protein [Myxococcales bacterium]|nr:CHAT domain-containing protein [Myxococcales bacterium]